jgi:hypothetical protein
MTRIPTRRQQHVAAAILLTSVADSKGWRATDDDLVIQATDLGSLRSLQDILQGIVDIGAAEVGRRSHDAERNVRMIRCNDHILWKIAQAIADDAAAGRWK